jgi:hypothetical protein
MERKEKNFIAIPRLSEQSIVLELLEWAIHEDKVSLSLDNVMRWLSDQLQCSLRLVEAASGQLLSGWTAAEYGHIDNKNYDTAYFEVETDKQKVHRLSLTAEGGRLPEKAVISQAAEAIRLYIMIWDTTCLSKDEDALLHAIMQNDSITVLELAREFRMDTDIPKDLWVLRAPPEGKPVAATLLASSAKQFFASVSKPVLVGTYDTSVLIWMNSTPFSELNEGLEEDLISSINSDLCLYVFRSLYLPVEIKNAYEMVIRYEKTLSRIYRRKFIFTRHDLYFANICELLLSGQKNAIDPICGLIDCLYDEDGDLLRTLATYYLDADGNTQKTGELLYMHSNTVKYRLHKIRQKLGMDIARMPANYNIYFSLALNRILDSFSEK